MAMFPTHIKTSTVLGIGYGVVTCVAGGVPPWTAAVATGLCSVAGILPDIDSGPGIPLREITTFLAAVIPTMLISRFLSFKMNQEMIILMGAVIYLFIRFGVAHFLRHYTVHRGMFHSFPAMAIFAELTYLLFYGESMATRLYMVSAVCIGFFSHLILDEIYSVDWKGEPRLKSSFGTACKFIGPVPWANASCYSKLAALTLFVLKDPSVVQQIYSGNTGQVAQTLEQGIASTLGNAKNAKGGTSVVNEIKQAASQYLTGNRGGQPANPQYSANQQYNNGQQPFNRNQNNWTVGQQQPYGNAPTPFNGQAQNYGQSPNYQQPRSATGPNYAPQAQYQPQANNAPTGYGQPNYAPTTNGSAPYGGQGGYAAPANYPQAGGPQGYQQAPSGASNPSYPAQSYQQAQGYPQGSNYSNQPNVAAPATGGGQSGFSQPGYGQPSYGPAGGASSPPEASLPPGSGASASSNNNSWRAPAMQ